MSSVYTKPEISIVIGSYNRSQMLQKCIDLIRRELASVNHEIIVVDGGSSDGALEWLVQQKDIVTIVQHNRGEWLGKKIERKPWAYFMNLALKSASAQKVCMLSDDSFIFPGAILNGMKKFDEESQRVKLGAVPFYFRDFPVRKRFSTAINLGKLYLNHGIYNKDALEEVGYIDEDYYFYFADTDLVFKMYQKGFHCIASEKSLVEHIFEATPEIRASNNDEKKIRDRQKLIDKWCGIIYEEKDREHYEKFVGRWNPHPEMHPCGYDYALTKELTCFSLGLSVEQSKWISIVTVSHNNKAGLIRTLNSIRKLNYPLIQWIVIDRASTDGTPEYLSRVKDYIDVHVSESDEGSYYSMNKGLGYAYGDYVMFLNAGDEFYDENTLSTAVEKISQIGKDTIFYGDHIEASGGAERYVEALPLEDLARKMPYKQQAAFFPKSAIEKFKYQPQYKVAADYDLCVRLFKAGYEFKYANFPVAKVFEDNKGVLGISHTLDLLKIQFDNFDEKQVLESSVYYRNFLNDMNKRDR
ncbi:glycosyltransferase family 2 protein [Alteromonas macleodii]|uniref:glycosyltransferase family 2 protein n=1 Tax=Alteromonas macleodii TaxID=28108 RepID=UPI003CFE2E89